VHLRLEHLRCHDDWLIVGTIVLIERVLTRMCSLVQLQALAGKGPFGIKHLSDREQSYIKRYRK
jgi:hypothetical protein